MNPTPRFSDFCLLELNHLARADIAEAVQTHRIEKAQQQLQERQDFAKKVIDTETKPGDTIMLESPEPWTFSRFKEVFKGSKNEWVWDGIMRDSLNFYFDLAEYAKSKGRKVESLESGLHQPESKLVYAAARGHEFEPETRERLDYLTVYRRDLSFPKKIAATKPKRVIATFFHAVSIEDALKPRRAVFFDRELNTPQIKSKILRIKQKAKAEYLNKKRKRRQIALQNTKFKPVRGFRKR
ncbi:MAG: hypothetical protein V1777_03770 [Candidatus Micrarchaeota archaeon]